MQIVLRLNSLFRFVWLCDSAWTWDIWARRHKTSQRIDAIIYYTLEKYGHPLHSTKYLQFVSQVQFRCKLIQFNELFGTKNETLCSPVGFCWCLLLLLLPPLPLSIALFLFAFKEPSSDRLMAFHPSSKISLVLNVYKEH